MPRKNTFYLEIPLTREQAYAAADTLDFMTRYAVWDDWESKDADADPLPSAPADDPRVDLALTFHRAICEQANLRSDVRIETLGWGPRMSRESPGPGYCLEISNRGDWGATSAAVAIVRVCQSEFGAPAVGFPYVEKASTTPCYGALIVAPGAEVEDFDLNQWINKQITDLRQQAKPAAAEPEAGP